MVVEPPFLEDHVLDRRNGSIVIGKGLLGDIEAEHARMEKGYEKKWDETAGVKAFEF